MEAYPFYQVDVFTNLPYHGNAVAVFPHAEGLQTHQMEQIARELNLSETAFVTPSDVATRRVRFFTPATEIPFSGHPTLGTWFILAETGELELDADGVTRVEQDIGAGILPVDIYRAEDKVTRVVMTQARPHFDAILDDFAIDRLEQVIGVPAGEISGASARPQVVSTGMRQLIVPIRKMAALSAAQPHQGHLSAFLQHYQTESVLCYSLEAVHPDRDAHCRVFAPALRVPEDPVTGSASGALGAFLVANGHGSSEEGIVRMSFEQGLEVGRQGLVNVEVEADEDGNPTDVRVGGECVLVLEGKVRVLPS
jgi:trans-2,3-dihydro-3-hydroxyanthranilate isomerase